MSWFDVGVNLFHESFQKDVHDVLVRAKDAKVSSMVLTGANLKSSQFYQEFTKKTLPVSCYFTSGIHPHYAHEFQENSKKDFFPLIQDKKCVAIGETGLDFYRNLSSKKEQISSFDAHLSWAEETKKPLFLHERDAHHDFLQTIKPYLSHLSSWVVHCFTGDERALDTYLSLGAYIGITGWITEKKRGESLRALVKKIPKEKLLLETDAPYLIPKNLNSNETLFFQRRNEPCLLPFVADMVAKCREESSDSLAKISEKNAKTFFGIS